MAPRNEAQELRDAIMAAIPPDLAERLRAWKVSVEPPGYVEIFADYMTLTKGLGIDPATARSILSKFYGRDPDDYLMARVFAQRGGDKATSVARHIFESRKSANALAARLEILNS